MTDRLAELGALQYAVENLSTAGTNPNRLGLAGYIHAAYTDYKAWAAANPGVNPNRLSAKGRLYGYFYDHASWSPLSLFASSEVGAWYDPSDLTTMFQDRAGTTQVTADGQTVGKILDKSGRGNHATAPSDAARPLYKTDGTYRWLQFDGVDDSLATAAIDFTATDKMSVFAGVYSTTPSNASMYTQLGTVFSGDGCFGLYKFSDARIYFASKGSGTLANPKTGTLLSPDTSVMTVTNDISGDVAVLRRNGSFVEQSTVDQGAGNYTNASLNIGYGVTSFWLFGRIYSLIVRGALSTPEEITNTETWVNSKTGAY